MIDPYDPPHPDGADDPEDLPGGAPMVSISWLDDDDSFEADDGYRLFEFGVEHAIFGERGSADDWPPVYTSWKAG